MSGDIRLERKKKCVMLLSGNNYSRKADGGIRRLKNGRMMARRLIGEKDLPASRGLRPVATRVEVSQIGFQDAIEKKGGWAGPAKPALQRSGWLERGGEEGNARVALFSEKFC